MWVFFMGNEMFEFLKLGQIKLRDNYLISSWAKESFRLLKAHCPKGYEEAVDYEDIVEAFLEYEKIEGEKK